MLFNSDINNFLLKTNGGETEPNFVICLVWSALIVDGWMVLEWSRNSCLGSAEIASFMFLVLFKVGGPIVSPSFVFLFPILIRGMGRQ